MWLTLQYLYLTKVRTSSLAIKSASSSVGGGAGLARGGAEEGGALPGGVPGGGRRLPGSPGGEAALAFAGLATASSFKGGVF